MDCKDMAMFSARVLDNKKARDIAVINIGTKAAFADYMVLASGGSERQIETLADELEEQFQKEGISVRNIEGKKHSGWILMDYGDIIVNLLTVDMRDKYNIEKVWGDCEFLDLED
ncbi:ribosome silencing factor [Anaerovorax odorimutans]|uniref:Ribosomal silencing factor RsfS n=1 Tax=Anaerovorax odorimutans TaxID=109327 RepID=A0ABT1RLU3_9FIRM|nr:ribosome silencing factor [Anaerovorax odorimutans]MCQ4635906.1 ribosome silencing factor [Anaerovorax odorimutans]